MVVLVVSQVYADFCILRALKLSESVDYLSVHFTEISRINNKEALSSAGPF